jgi:hypothetical protein
VSSSRLLLSAGFQQEEPGCYSFSSDTKPQNLNKRSE